jgi:hypothetical protein
MGVWNIKEVEIGGDIVGWFLMENEKELIESLTRYSRETFQKAC